MRIPCPVSLRHHGTGGGGHRRLPGRDRQRQPVDAWKGLDWEQPTYVVALAQGEDIDPWRQTPDGADGSTLPVPGLFTDVAKLAGYSATRSEDPVLQLRIMVGAIGEDGRLRIDPKAMVRLCATGKAMLDDIDRCGLPEKRLPSGEDGLAPA